MSTTGAARATPAGPRAFDRDHRSITVGLLALVTMFAFEAVAVSLAMPSVAHALDGETLYPIAVIGMLTAAVVGMVTGGIWADARGPSLPLLLGGVGFVAGLLMSGAASSMELFVIGRLLQGLGAGSALTALYVAVGDAYPPALRPRVFSLFATAWVLPSIAGPFVAGALVDLLGWRSVFLVVAGFALVCTVFVRATLEPHLRVRAAPIAWGRRPAYALLAASGAVVLHVAGHGEGAGQVLLLTLGLGALALSLPPLLPAGTLRARNGLPATVAARGVFGAAFACLELFVPLVLQDESGLSPTLTGLVMMTGALGWVAGSTYTGKRAQADLYGGILRVGAVSLVIGSVVSMLMVPLGDQPWLASIVASVGLTVMGLGMGLVTPLLSTLALDLSEPGRQGEAGAAIQMSDSLGQSVAAGLVGAAFARWYLLDQESSYFSGLGLAVVLALLAAAFVGRAVRR